MGASSSPESAVQLLTTWPSPYGIRAELALASKGVSYEKLPEDLSKKSQLLLDSNPVYKKIPVLLHNGKAVPESCLIVQYVDEAWPSSSANNLLPSDPYDRAVARFWGDYVEKKFFDAAIDILKKKGEEQKAAIENTMECLATLEEAFKTVSKGGPFFGGATVGYVDIVWGPFVAWYHAFEAVGKFKFPFEDKYPHLHSWLQAMKENPKIASALPEPQKITEFVLPRFA